MFSHISSSTFFGFPSSGIYFWLFNICMWVADYNFLLLLISVQWWIYEFHIEYAFVKDLNMYALLFST